MEKRKIAGRTVKAIGLGVMALDEYKPKAEEKDAIELLKHAVKLEVDFFDTADVYGLGRNEELIGKEPGKYKIEINPEKAFGKKTVSTKQTAAKAVTKASPAANESIETTEKKSAVNLDDAA